MRPALALLPPHAASSGASLAAPRHTHDGEGVHLDMRSEASEGAEGEREQALEMVEEGMQGSGDRGGEGGGLQTCAEEEGGRGLVECGDGREGIAGDEAAPSAAREVGEEWRGGAEEGARDSTETKDNEAVLMTLTLGLEFSEAGVEGSAVREAFVREVTADLAAAGGVPAGAFRISKVSAGSVVLDIQIVAVDGPMMEAGGGVGARTPAAVGAALQEQAADAGSPLRTGKLTRHTTGVRLVCKRAPSSGGWVLDSDTGEYELAPVVAPVGEGGGYKRGEGREEARWEARGTQTVGESAEVGTQAQGQDARTLCNDMTTQTQTERLEFRATAPACAKGSQTEGACLVAAEAQTEATATQASSTQTQQARLPPPPDLHSSHTTYHDAPTAPPVEQARVLALPLPQPSDPTPCRVKLAAAAPAPLAAPPPPPTHQLAHSPPPSSADLARPPQESTIVAGDAVAEGGGGGSSGGGEGGGCAGEGAVAERLGEDGAAEEGVADAGERDDARAVATSWRNSQLVGSSPASVTSLHSLPAIDETGDAHDLDGAESGYASGSTTWRQGSSAEEPYVSAFDYVAPFDCVQLPLLKCCEEARCQADSRQGGGASGLGWVRAHKVRGWGSMCSDWSVNMSIGLLMLSPLLVPFAMQV